MNKDELFHLKAKQINQEKYEEIKVRWDKISKPLDGLGDFEKIIAQIHSILDENEIIEFKKAIVIFCGDHGIVSEGVSQCGQDVTGKVAKLLGESRSTASRMAKYAKVDCIPVDVGINCEEEMSGVRQMKVKRGTNNFLDEPAMTESEALSAINVGISMAKECKMSGYHILATGEMGIGNTTSGTALLCAITENAVEKVVGRGAGLSDEGLEKKTIVIRDALKKYNLFSNNNMSDFEKREYALLALCKVGGFEIAAMTGAFLGGAIYGIPVMIDGMISAVAALIASKIMPESVKFMLPSHAGREHGTKIVLDELKLSPLIGGDMALGEGTGALMAMPLLDMTLDFFIGATTFDAGGIKQYQRNI